MRIDVITTAILWLGCLYMLIVYPMTRKDVVFVSPCGVYTVHDNTVKTGTDTVYCGTREKAFRFTAAALKNCKKTYKKENE